MEDERILLVEALLEGVSEIFHLTSAPLLILDLLLEGDLLSLVLSLLLLKNVLHVLILLFERDNLVPKAISHADKVGGYFRFSSSLSDLASALWRFGGFCTFFLRFLRFGFGFAQWVTLKLSSLFLG